MFPSKPMKSGTSTQEMLFCCSADNV